jgi:hypothetical protein
MRAGTETVMMSLSAFRFPDFATRLKFPAFYDILQSYADFVKQNAEERRRSKRHTCASLDGVARAFLM